MWSTHDAEEVLELQHSGMHRLLRWHQVSKLPQDECHEVDALIRRMDGSNAGA